MNEVSKGGGLASLVFRNSISPAPKGGSVTVVGRKKAVTAPCGISTDARNTCPSTLGTNMVVCSRKLRVWMMTTDDASSINNCWSMLDEYYTLLGNFPAYSLSSPALERVLA